MRTVPSGAPRMLPAHVYAPYFETWTTHRLTTTARTSGARYFALAFLQAPKKGSCTLTWNGNPRQPVTAGRYVADIARLRRLGGDVVPSFGGFSADQGGTEIADSCTSVAKIARAYESVITTYHVTRLDMDVEARSLNNAAGIDRRNRAIAITEKWAAARGLHVQFQYTLPVETYGLDPNEVAVLRNAVSHGVRIASINIMVFDYYLPREGTVDMGAAGISAALNVHTQLARLHPADTAPRLWAMEGMTLMPGIDDHPGKLEVTHMRDAAAMLRFAEANRMNFLSIWAIQRDNGGCPGRAGSNSCSGIRQPRWAFSRLLGRFTR